MLAERPDAKLLIVGTGPYEGRLRRDVAKRGLGKHVEFMSFGANHRDDLVRLLRTVSLVVLLSDFETQPLVALEAVAAGRRLLVADRAGLHELAEDGLARAISPDASPSEVGQAIVEELESRQPRTLPRLSSWDERAMALLDLYEQVVAVDRAAAA